MLQAIKDHKDQRGHDRCWLDDQRLYTAAGLLDANTALPPQEEFIQNCRAYWHNRQNPDHKYLNLADEIQKAQVQGYEYALYFVKMGANEEHAHLVKIMERELLFLKGVIKRP